jgi:hypothetical protein
MPTRLLFAVACTFLAAVIAGLTVLGSPATARERRFDAKRIEDLSEIDLAIRDQHADAGRLPATLSEIGNHPAALIDPVTARPYEYRVIAEDAFELCATFQQPSATRAYRWQHGAGRHCFKRSSTMKAR